SSDVVALAQPFYAQETPWGASFSWRRSSYVASLFQSGAEVADLDVRNHEWELWAGPGWVRDGTILRAVGSLYMQDRVLGPTRLDPGAPPDFAGNEETLDLR